MSVQGAGGQAGKRADQTAVGSRARFVLASVRWDAEIEAGYEDGDCKLSVSEWADAVLALVDVAEAAHENAEYHNPISHKLRRMLDRFEFGPSAPVPGASRKDNRVG